MRPLALPILALPLFALPTLAEEGIEFVSPEEAASAEEAGPQGEEVEELARPKKATSATDSVDRQPPTFGKVEVHPPNAERAALLSAVIEDPGVGVAEALLYYRVDGGPFQRLALKAEENAAASGVYHASLPPELSSKGFAYYLEATDRAGNGPARHFSPDAPEAVPPLKMEVKRPMAPRVKKASPQVKFEKPPPPIHPGWVALTLGLGVASAGASAIFWNDYFSVQRRLEGAEGEDPVLRSSLQSAADQDLLVASIASSVGGVGLAVGTGLLVYSVVTQE
jgi:hypothetical protein